MYLCHINLAKGFSGGEQQTLNLIAELATRGLRQILVCREGGEVERRAREKGIPCHPVSHFLFGHLRGLGTDLLHGHCGKSIYWAALEHQFRGTPYLVTRRVDNPLSHGVLTRRAYRDAARVVCLSRAIESSVQACVGPVPTGIIPSTYSGFQIDPAEVARLRQAWSGRFLVGQIGNLLAHKGHDVTFEAASRLAGTHPHLHFLILGDGPRRQELEQAASALPNVTLLGHRKDIGNYLAILDLFVFPSLSEGLGSSILEAMQAEIPVIASEAGGIPDLIDHKRTGILIPPGDAEALTGAISRLEGNPDLRTALAGEATRQLEKFSPSSVADRYLATYTALISPSIH
ncbi:glycosyltransferase [Holophaga foetida]|uniref:glycosyltransferase n=1 Tax=Holophaga foetida TaxID=35839 RepID=UPI0002473B45|nr:glycosyltransferase [Holophaga foetida]